MQVTDAVASDPYPDPDVVRKSTCVDILTLITLHRNLLRVPVGGLCLCVSSWPSFFVKH